ncbi:MAG: cytochrome b/b6 domain-containing protein [Alcanivoracaceae bacterium]|nr:cytochrome b/b6 domain-containing protein [Alcanivoracaceae bacterium]
MKIYNTKENFGLITILIHWIMAIIIIGLFILGKYMLSLDYYDSFYHIGPWWHKSFGLLILFLLILRLIWKTTNPKVKPLPNNKLHEIKLAKTMQYLLYILMIICCMSGVLISTAEDAGVSFFDILELPAFIANGESQAELAGEIHEYSTLALILLAALHLLAAFKHHFIDKDKTLLRILTTKT